MTFFALRDYKNKSNDHSEYLSLRVDIGQGVESVPDMDINITKLNNTGGIRYNHFFSNGYAGTTFKIRVLIKSTDKWNGAYVTNQLHDWFKNMTPLHVVTEAIDVPDGEYLISSNPTRQQNKKGFTEWDLEFTTYTPLALYKYKNNNAAVLKALKKAKAGNKSNSKKSAVNTKLKKCGLKYLKYSKKKKTYTCVKYMQQVLQKKKLLTKAQVDGWYGPVTLKAVKRFQITYNKKVKITSKTTNTTKLVVYSGTLVTKTKGKANISLPAGTKLSKRKANKGASKAVISGISKLLPENGKVDSATFKALYTS